MNRRPMRYNPQAGTRSCRNQDGAPRIVDLSSRQMAYERFGASHVAQQLKTCSSNEGDIMRCEFNS